MELSSTVVTPESNQILVAGSSVGVRIRGREAGGRLVGVGYEARVGSFERPLIDSAMVVFRPSVEDTTVRFDFAVPEDFPNNGQINFLGIAFGPDGAREVSEPRASVVIRCGAVVACPP